MKTLVKTKLILYALTLTTSLIILFGCEESKNANDTNSSSQYTYAKLEIEFKEFAKKKDVEINEKIRVAAGWYENIFVAHTGLKSNIKFEEGRPMSILLIKSDEKRKFQNQNNRGFNSGIYLVKAFIKEGSEKGHINLESINGDVVASLALNKGNGGAGCGSLSHSCENVSNVSIHFKPCEICIDWYCASACHDSCFKIPFCDKLTGILNQVVAIK